MKVLTISKAENLKQQFDDAQCQGYVTFIYKSADPQETLKANKFLYVRSAEELREKIALIEADKLIENEIMRF